MRNVQLEKPTQDSALFEHLRPVATSRDPLAEFTRAIKDEIFKEQIPVTYTKLGYDFSDTRGGYCQNPPHIYVDSEMFGGDCADEPFILAHEFGHHLDCKNRLGLEKSDFESETAANNYMLEMARRFGLEERALELEDERMKEFKR